MALKQVIISRPSQLPLAMRTLHKALEGSLRDAAVRAARFGHTAVVRMMAKTDPKPEATYTYRNAWQVVKTRHGAILGNSALSSYFVEVGRQPGRMPPYSDPTHGILHWVQAKRFRFKDGQIIKRKKGKKGKPKTAAQKKVDAQKKKAKGDGEKSVKAKKPGKAQGKQLETQKRFAFLVARKIARKGTPGRFVLMKTMPAIRKRFDKEIKKSLKAITPKSA